VLGLLEKQVDLFYIRARRSENLGKKLAEIKQWKVIEIKGEKAYCAEIEYTHLREQP